MSQPVTLEVSGDIAVIRIDDGKANALGHVVLDGINAALDDAAAAKAVVLFGREGKFSAGFDLAVMNEGAEAAQAMVRKGAELCMRLYGFPVPVLAGSNGHALAAGAVVLLSCDVRIGTDRPGNVGLPEIAIGMPLPIFLTELANDRLSRRFHTEATLLAKIYPQSEAKDAGFLDQIVAEDALESTVLDRARELADALNPGAFARSRTKVRGATIERVLSTLDEDMAVFTVATGD